MRIEVHGGYPYWVGVTRVTPERALEMVSDPEDRARIAEFIRRQGEVADGAGADCGGTDPGGGSGDAMAGGAVRAEGLSGIAELIRRQAREWFGLRGLDTAD